MKSKKGKTSDPTNFNYSDSFKILADIAPEGIVIHSEGKFVYVNHEAKKIFGAKSDKEIIGKSVFSIMHPDSIEVAKKRVQEIVLENKTAEPMVEKIICPDGIIKEIRISAAPIIYNEKPSVLLIATDITDEKRINDSIKEKEQKLEAIFEALPDIIMTIGNDGRFLDCNTKSRSLLYAEPEFFIGKNISEILPKDIADQTFNHLKLLKESKKVQIFDYKLDIGTESKYFEARLTNKSEDEAIVVIRDISEEKNSELKIIELLKNEEAKTEELIKNNQALEASKRTNTILIVNLKNEIKERKIIEKALRESETKFSVAFHNSPVPMVMVNVEDDKFYDVNEAIIKETGYSREDFIGKTPKEVGLYYSYDDRELLIKNVKNNKKVSGLPAKIRLKNGEIRDFLISTSLVSFSNKQYYLTSSFDITTIRQAEEKIKLNEQRQQKYASLLSELIKQGSFFQDDFEENIKNITEISAKMINVERVSIWLYENEEKEIRCIDLYELSKNLHSSGEMWKTDEFPNYTASHRAGEVIDADDVFTDPRTSSIPIEYFTENKIVSMLDAPVWIQGKLAALLSFEHIGGKRHWLSDEKQLATTLSSYVSLCIETFERRKVRDELQKSEENYRFMFENNPQPMWIYDLETLKYVAVNNAAIHQYGYSKDEFLSMTLMDIRPEEDIPLLLKDVEQTVSKLNPSGIWRHKKKNGEIIFVEITSHEIEFNGRKARHVLIKDITEKKLAEELLKESEERYDTFINTNKDLMFIKDENFRYILANNATLEFFGKSREELLNKTDFELMDEKSANACKESDQKVIASNSTIVSEEYVNERSYETTKFPIKLKSGKIGIGAIIRDITDKKVAEREVKLLAHSIESINECVSITNLEDKILFVNNSFLKTYGYEREEIIGKHISILRPKEVTSMIGNEILSKTSDGQWVGELINIKKDKTIFPINLSTSVVRDENNKPIAYIGVTTDITEKKKMIDELIHAKERAEEMNKIKSHFFANMSHELRTPFVGIMGYAELILDTTHDEKVNDMARGILRSSKRLSETLNSILDLSKLEFKKEEIRIKETEVRNLLEEIYRNFVIVAEKKNIALKKDIKFERLYINIDDKHFASIVNNLVSNAIKYTNQGFVKIIAEDNLIKGERYLVIKIEDTGIGIPKDKQEIIWHTFRQVSEGTKRSFEGTGLGLSIARQLAELLGGNIYLESEIGKGSTFIFSLPISEIISNTVLPKPVFDKYLENSEKSKVVSAKNISVLYVEDDEVARELVSLYMPENYQLDLAESAEEALEKIKDSKYDLFLLDVNLRRGMDGAELMEEIRKLDIYKSVPIVAVTAYAAQGDITEFISRGFSHYLSKPFQRADFINILEKAIM